MKFQTNSILHNTSTVNKMNTHTHFENRCVINDEHEAVLKAIVTGSSLTFGGGGITNLL